jgi:hypothetical protein
MVSAAAPRAIPHNSHQTTRVLPFVTVAWTWLVMIDGASCFRAVLELLCCCRHRDDDNVAMTDDVASWREKHVMTLQNFDRIPAKILKSMLGLDDTKSRSLFAHNIFITSNKTTLTQWLNTWRQWKSGMLSWKLLKQSLLLSILPPPGAFRSCPLGRVVV